MSTHRYPCTAEPPELIGVDAGHCRSTGGNHQCMHDAADDGYRLVEHECRCGMTWRASNLYRPAPDTSWITFEKPHRTLKALTWIKLAATLMLVGVVLAIAVTLVIR